MISHSLRYDIEQKENVLFLSCCKKGDFKKKNLIFRLIVNQVNNVMNILLGL